AEADAPLLLDESRQPRGGPEFGGKAVVGGAVGQPAPDDLLLGGGQLGGPAAHGPCCQAARAVGAEGGVPAADAAGIDAEEFGDLRNGEAIEQALDSQATAVLQFSW